MLATTDLHPTAYICETEITVCKCCAARFEAPTVYAKMPTGSSWGLRTAIHLHILSWPSRLFNLPINFRRSKPRSVPFCHLCNEPSLAHFPSPPQPAHANIPDWLTTPPTTRGAGAPAPSPTRRTAKPKPSLDDLLS